MTTLIGAAFTIVVPGGVLAGMLWGLVEIRREVYEQRRANRAMADLIIADMDAQEGSR